jgi:O-methyltransferase
MNYVVETWIDKVLDQDFLDVVQETADLNLQLLGEYDIKSFDPYERHYILWHGLKQTVDLPGNFVQCGVYSGEQAFFMAKLSDKTVYLFDSFEGATDFEESDNDYYRENPFKVSLESAQATLAQFDNVSLNKGPVPYNFELVDQISLLHIDVDLYRPTKISIDELWPKIVDGGILMVDTHDNVATGATKAVTEFAASIGKEIQMLPAGIAVITK